MNGEALGHSASGGGGEWVLVGCFGSVNVGLEVAVADAEKDTALYCPPPPPAVAGCRPGHRAADVAE